MKKTFNITTPIYYVNDKPHIGHAYTTIVADVLARYHRLLGEDVFFLVGTDENAQKNVESACKKFGDDGDTREKTQNYVDEMSEIWRQTWETLKITNDDFIRTSEKRHTDFVIDFWKKVDAAGDIYKDSYEGLYCTGCESYKTESDLVNGMCPDHKRVPEKLSEENYFFKLTKYRDALLKHIKENPDFIQPSSRKNEIISFIKDFAKDFSISRENLEWGIPVPDDNSQTIYVWFDALTNYISANPERWPADLHLVGKDIIKFHCAYWPAMLMSAGMELPKSVYAHGFFTIDGEKMSKTIGNVVDPVELCTDIGIDPVRYYLLKEIAFGTDGDFSITRLKERYNGDLANELGNLLSRTTTMVHKFTDGVVPAVSENHKGEIATAWGDYELGMEKYKFHNVIDAIWSLVRLSNQYIEEKAPWALAKEGKNDEVAATMYTLLENMRHVAWMLLPIMPDTAYKMFTSLGYNESDVNGVKLEDAKMFGLLEPGTKIIKGDILFPRLD